jgi:hypothetical protein
LPPAQRSQPLRAGFLEASTMTVSVAFLSLFPLIAWTRLAVRGWRWREALQISLLFAVGLAASGPFLTSSAIGTNESFNYSLAVGDTVEQMRKGVFPVFVGQSPYAFNGRLHPLRTAVYFTHGAGVLDLLTFRQLSFWHIQNLSLAVSLMAAGFSAYACLRRVLGGSSPWVAWGLAVWFVLCPGLLAPAYGMDLYMTVTAAPFLPVALLGAVRSAMRPGFQAYATAAVGLAGSWLTHPPVAAWMCLGCVFPIAYGLIARREGRHKWISLAGATLLGLALSGWAFASTLTLGEGFVSEENKEIRAVFSRLIAENTTATGWAALLPVAQGGMVLGDFQLGYAGWLLLGVSAVLAWRTRHRVVGALLIAVVFFLVLTLPVPRIHAGLWNLMPAAFSSLTNVWPMQRAYLVIATFTVFAFALVWPSVAEKLAGRTPLTRVFAWGLLILASTWTFHEAWQFIRRGHQIVHTPDATAAMYRSGNFSLMRIAYGFVGLPDNYHGGPRDPQFELRLLSDREGGLVLADNASSGGERMVVAEGTFKTAANTGAGQYQLSPSLRLDPGNHYRLRFNFRAVDFNGTLVFQGTKLRRELPLREEMSKRGFGMLPGQSRILPLWVSGGRAEEIWLSLLPNPGSGASGPDFADFVLEEVDPTQLPLRLLQLTPTLKCEIDAAEAGWLETPRMFIPGYTAKVDGRVVHPRRGRDGLTLVPVPAGRSTVELSYEAPAALRTAAHVSIGSWAVIALLGLGAPLLDRRLARARHRNATAALSEKRGQFLRRRSRRAIACAIILLGVLAGAGWHYRWFSSGPVEMHLAFPIHTIGKSEPLLSFGDGEKSGVIFIRYLDRETIRLGVDIWGGARRESEPLRVNYREPHRLKITTGSLYWKNDPRLRRLGSAQLDWLTQTTRIWLDGAEVLSVALPDLPSEGLSILRNATGNGSHLNRFGGVVVNRSRRPVAEAECPLPSDHELANEAGPLRFNLKLPGHELGQGEPLMSFGGPEPFCLFIHYVDGANIRLGVEGPNLPLLHSEIVPIDYRQPLNLLVSHPALYPSGHPELAGYSPKQLERLRGRFRVSAAGRSLIAFDLKDAEASAKGKIEYGRNAVGARFPRPSFSGAFVHSERLGPPDWPLPPGNPERATTPDSVGPMKITARLPTNQTGRTQPLLTLGRPGEGTIVMLNYQDAAHVRIGVDVWNKALLWSEPVAVDYMQTQTFTVSLSAFYPEDHPSVRALPPADWEKLRNEVMIALNGTTVLRESIFAYDAQPEAITPGESLIGGSHNEAKFLGELHDVSRLPVAPQPSH